METIKNETVMTSQYIDRIGIVQIVEQGKSDEEIGKHIREYILWCKQQFDDDTLFPNSPNMIGYKPTTFNEKFKIIS
jgi:hypothetical protein